MTTGPLADPQRAGDRTNSTDYLSLLHHRGYVYDGHDAGESATTREHLRRPLTITGTAPDLSVNGVPIDPTKSDIAATNGVIQGLDALLDVASGGRRRGGRAREARRDRRSGEVRSARRDGAETGRLSPGAPDAVVLPVVSPGLRD